MMLRCYICHSAQYPTVTSLQLHIRRHESCGEGSLPYVCNQNGCLNSYGELRNLARHIRTRHVDLTAAEINEEANCRPPSLDLTTVRTTGDADDEIGNDSCNAIRELGPNRDDLANDFACLASELLHTIEHFSQFSYRQIGSNVASFRSHWFRSESLAKLKTKLNFCRKFFIHFRLFDCMLIDLRYCCRLLFF